MRVEAIDTVKGLVLLENGATVPIVEMYDHSGDATLDLGQALVLVAGEGEIWVSSFVVPMPWPTVH